MRLMDYCLKLNDNLTQNVEKFVVLEKSEDSLTPLVFNDYGQLLSHSIIYDTEFICSTLGYDEKNKKMMILYGVKQ